jgi:hypothetical protein
LPSSALLHANAGVAHVYIVNNTSDTGATASMRQVSFTQSSLEGHVEAQGPLHEGDRVILEPLDKLSDGTRISVKGEKAGTTNAAH